MRLSKAKKVLCFFTTIILVTMTVSACKEPLNTSSTGMGTPFSKIESSDGSSTISETESVLESSDQTSEVVKAPKFTKTDKTAPEGFKSYIITFQYLNVEVVLPETWVLEVKNDSTTEFGDAPQNTLAFYSDDVEVGYINNSAIESWVKNDFPEGNKTSDIMHEAVCNMLRAGHTMYDNYQSIMFTKNTGIGIADSSKTDFEPIEEGTTIESKIIIAYDIGLKDYIYFDIDKDVLTQEELETIAESTTLTAVE
ncbi:MAG: hypothetical protein PHY15_08850 [Eubacteriales bacterium]|nr:hypothetical protein [Eubacteriales bacterium]MDD4475355.1 hypothetical protein [Eubacteriales bacterium]